MGSLSVHTVAIASISILTIIFLFLDWRNGKANSSFPSFLITVGIAFTFWGIATGLSDFNTEDPTMSLPTLVNGIKTAFWGSFAGVVGSIILRVISPFITSNDENLANNFYAEHTELTEVLKSIDKKIDINNRNLVQAVQNLGVNLGEESKNNMQSFFNQISSDLSGLKQVQEETQGVIAKEMQELKTAFVEFAEKQRQDVLESFIDALRKAIEDFNKQLADSLGENFKQLNQAVLNLVEWQNNYKAHVEHQTEQYKIIASQVQQVTKDFEFFLQHIEGVRECTSQTYDEVVKIVEIIHDKNIEFNKRIEEFYSTLDKKLISVNELKGMVNQTLANLRAEITSSKEMRENIRISLDELQKALEEALTTLGRQLGSLSSKFAEDYTPITNKLQKMLIELDTVNLDTKNKGGYQ